MRFNFNYLMLHASFCATIFIACSSPITSDCGIHEFASEDNIPFQEKLWQKDFFETDSFKNKNMGEQYSSSRHVLRIRENMLCNLIFTLKINKPTYDQVLSILGKGEATNTYGSARCEPTDKEWDWSNFGYHLPEKIKNKEALIYYVGYNASGDCYLVIAFNDGRYGHSLRVFAY